MAGRRLNVVWLTLVAALSAASVPAQDDVAGSRDPTGLERYPGSRIVDYRRDSEVAPRRFVLSRVDRIRRELVVDDELHPDAALEALTYQTPEGSTPAEVAAHFRRQLAGGVLFGCDGRACGRSADWANQVFEQATLYGLDRHQHYLAAQWRDGLVAVYVIERGNQRVYAHVRVLEPVAFEDTDPNRLLPQRLKAQGWAVIDGVRPGMDGTLDDGAGVVLSGLGQRLRAANDFGGRPIYVVCHLYGAAGAEVLLAASQRCARTGAQWLAAMAQEGVGGPEFLPFGAGPLMPRAQFERARLELVVPSVAVPGGRP